jgi:MoxR-like ATPase
MKKPFMVLATQNPIDQEGTYRLPEAQLDRFLFKIVVDYPNMDEEIQIISSHHKRKNKPKTEEIKPVLKEEDILKFQALTHEVNIDNPLLSYIAGIVNRTREHPFLYLGASPRASLAIMQAAKAFALLDGRDFVTPEDIKKAAVPVLIHRIIVTPEREMEGMTPQKVIEQILENIEVPR